MWVQGHDCGSERLSLWAATTNDMAGPEEDAWKSILIKEGYEVDAVLIGLGSNNDFVNVFVDHIADAAKERGLNQK